METIGDCVLVTSSRDSSDDESLIEFERNLDVIKKTLDDEETKLISLEEKRVELQEEISRMQEEILQEKKQYRKAIDGIIEEREKLSRSIIESCDSPIEITPIQSSLSLFESNGYKVDIEIDSEIEKIRCDLMDSYISTKKDYLNTIKDHFKSKHEHDTD